METAKWVSHFDEDIQHGDPVNIFREEWDSSQCGVPLWMKSYGFRNCAEDVCYDLIRLLENNLPRIVEHWETEPNVYRFYCGDLDIVIEVSPDEEFFVLPPKLTNSHFALSRTQIDPLRACLRNAVKQEACHLKSFFDFTLLILRLLEEVSASCEEWDPRKKQSMILGKDSTRGLEYLTEVDRDYFPLSWLLETNLNSTMDVASSLFGLSVREICENIPSAWKIIHVESVLRRDLVRLFISRQAELLQAIKESSLSEAHLKRLNVSGNEKVNKVRMSRDDIEQDLIRPRLTFHGTSKHLVPSIVRSGFLLPGTLIGNAIVGGVKIGRGIYSSPESFYAMSYAHGSGMPTTSNERPGLRLFVCATLMGRTDTDIRRTHKPIDQNFDSQITANKLEYIVYHPAQILPCFVIHLDLTTKAAVDTMEFIQASPVAFMERQKYELFQRRAHSTASPGDLQRIKEAKKAAVQKWFPYGYGPAKGTSFVIEEIGEVSDDEENYGDYQAAREEAWDFLDDDGGSDTSAAQMEGKWARYKRDQQRSWMDEYTAARYDQSNVEQTGL